MRALRAALLVLALLVSARPGARAADAERHLLLEVFINGHSTGQIGDFLERDKKLFATRHDLRQLGFTAAKSGADDALMPLADIPDITFRLDEPTQTLHVTAPDAALIPSALAAEEHDRLTPVRSGLGAVLNYDITETYASSENAVRGLFDGRIFTPYGVFDSQYLGSVGYGGGSVRLDTSFSYSDPDSLRRYRVGDFINGGLTWTRPIRMGGAQVDTNFGVRPDLVTFPLPQISGSAAVPSTVDVLVNNVRLLSRSVDPGPFAVTQLPVVNGAGSVTVVVQNALGQQTTQTLPFYTTNTLLAPGLASYSAEIGAIRQNYSLQSDDYSTPVVSGSVRYGVFRFLTVEAHAEGSSSLGMGGGGVAVNVGNIAVISAAAAGSYVGGQSGMLFSGSIERVTPRLSLSASIQQATPGFRDVAAISGDPVPRQEVRAAAGLSLGRFGSLSLAYTGLNQQPSVLPKGNALLDPLGEGFESSTLAPTTNGFTRTSLVTASYTAQILGNVYGFATGYHDFGRSGATGFLVGVSIPLGDRRNVSVSAGSTNHQAFATGQATQAAAEIGQYGGMVLNQNGSPNRQLAQGEYLSSFGRFNAGADRIGHDTALRASAAGALVLADGTVFATNTVQDSFAVVDTGGTPGIGVLQENRPVGKTDSSGRLLLPNLQSFADNRIGIDPAAVPVDADMASSTETVRPQDRSGVVVKFPLRSNRGAVLHLVDESGAALPLGSTAVLQSEPAPNVVGFDGMAFLRHLEPHNTVVVTLPNGKTCTASFDFKEQPGSLPDLGKLTCRGAAK